MTPMVPLETAARATPRVPYADFPAQFAAQREELLGVMERVLRRGDFILGEEVGTLERDIAALCGLRHAVGVASGTDALILALKALEIGPGDEVITVPNSWISSTSSIVLSGARPVFVDVRDDFNMDPARIESAITPRTKAILPVHLTGRCADMEAICAVAARHGLAVIEDAAQALGAGLTGRAAGSFGTMGCFSFHPLKNLSGIGDGGMVVTRDDRLAERLRLLRNHGLRSRDEAILWGLNSRLDTIDAAVLRWRLTQLPAVTEARRRHAARYRAALASTVSCPVDRPEESAIYHLFMIQCERRDALRRWLSERGIGTKIHYPTPIHLQPCARSLGYRQGAFPVAEAQAQRILSLPVHQHLSAEQIEYVAQSIAEFTRG